MLATCWQHVDAKFWQIFSQVEEKPAEQKSVNLLRESSARRPGALVTVVDGDDAVTLARRNRRITRVVLLEETILNRNMSETQ